MQNLKNLPSISASPKTAAQNGHAEALPPAPTPAAPVRRRSLRMQMRYLRVMIYSVLLFGRLIFWQVIVARYFPRWVERTSIARWRKYARGFRDFAIQMGGVMIKAGQFVSTRADIMPQEVIDELASLRDEVPSVPSDQIRAIVERELGSIGAHFSVFDDQPIAAASLGQVHRARLLNDERVVVKVLRPGIVDVCHTDLAALVIVSKIAMRFRFISRRADAVALTHEFGRGLMEELSYLNEARNAQRFGQMFKDDFGVYIPAVYPEHSTDCVLTLEDVTSIKLDNYAALEAAGISRKAVAKRLMDTYLTQIFEERFFHADPHPGNLFVYPLPEDAANGHHNGQGRPFYLIFIDFGMTGSLTESIRSGLINTMVSVVTRDADMLIRSYSELGFLLPSADTERLTQATKAVFDKVWGMTMSQMSNVSYDQMAEIGREFSDLMFEMPFQMPQDFIYLGRTFGILSGMCTSLDPTFNPWQELQPFTQQLIVQRNGSSANAAPVGGLVGSMVGSPILQSLFSGNGGQALLNIGQALLGRSSSTSADAILARMERGDFKMIVEPSRSYYKQLNRIEAQNRRTAWAMLTSSGLISATLLYINGDVIPAIIAGIVSGVLFVGVVLTSE